MLVNQDSVIAGFGITEEDKNALGEGEVNII
jgi:hypothetical protein